ncbi:MAG: NADH-quinone oxidoreductase subunit NuoF [Nitrospirota bacterium]
MELILFKDRSVPNLKDIDVYIGRGGYQSLEKGLKLLKPDEIIDIVKRSGLRGRGGAGFPTGAKWDFIPKGKGIRKYLCCNADESEPGSFKDRELMEFNPHLLIEGIILASYAIGAAVSYIYIRGELVYAFRILEKAIREVYERGFLGKDIRGSGFDLDVFIHRGAGAYICGEETALIESLEGKRGMPRVKPPFPAFYGLYGKPTMVNNVETLCNIPYIVTNGHEKFASQGRPRNTGTKIYCMSGDINNPGNYELPLGIPLRHLIYDVAGGIRSGRALKAVIPGGASAAMLTPDKIDILMDFDSLAAAGSMLGTAGVIVMDETRCMVKVALTLSRFFFHESCGKCTPCREGTFWMHEILKKLETGDGKDEDVDLLLDVANNIGGRTICALADGAIAPVISSIRHFGEDYRLHVKEAGCPYDRIMARV